MIRYGESKYERDLIMATRVLGYDLLASNAEAYWVNFYHLDLHIEMRIYLDSEEGKGITKLITEAASSDSVRGYLLRLWLKKVTVEDFTEMLKATRSVSFRSGYNHHVGELRRLMEEK